MATRKRVLLLSKPGGFASELLRFLESDKAYAVELETLAKDALNSIKGNRVDTLVLNLDQFGFRQLHLIEQIRTLGYNFPILVFAEEIVRTAGDLGSAFSKVTVFGKKFIKVDRDLNGLMTRFFNPEVKHPVPHRQSERHATRQKAMVENLRTKNKFSAVATNLSAHGAQIEFQAGNLTLNDKVDMVVHLSKLAKTHVVQGHVTWFKVSQTGMRSAGIKFTKKGGRSLAAV